MPIALITGASRGLGEALARRLAADGWSLVLDARGADALGAVASGLPANTAGHGVGAGKVVAVAGDVADPTHRDHLVEAAAALGGLDALVNNASILGPSPRPTLADYPVGALRAVFEVNVVAPLALAAAALPLLRKSPTVGRIVNVTSDAGAEAYEGWGGYGSSKAALEHASRVLALEEPDVRVYVVDPGDMRTQMHQEAFPGEDISDRPPPEVSVPGLLPLLTADLPSGRYVARELGAATA
ncbi:MAG: SDR family oxidoreductase [Actinobacteria bacterium]|nr:SDR family oxidoreductase [Actinomycetota bacterium]